MKPAAPEFQTEYCTWARPLKTRHVPPPETADLVSLVSKIGASARVCAASRVLDSYVMIKGGEGALTDFLSVCWSDQ